jgi:hypothetical protein
MVEPTNDQYVTAWDEAVRMIAMDQIYEATRRYMLAGGTTETLWETLFDAIPSIAGESTS